MYGTVGRFRVKPGRLDDLIGIFNEWERDFRPRIPGALHTFAYQMDADSNVVLAVAVFKDKESYVANADSPEQDKWYQRLRECLNADPEWNDGTIVAGS